MEKVKKKLKSLCRPGLHVRPEFAWPLEEEPFEVRILDRALDFRSLTCSLNTGREGDDRVDEDASVDDESKLGCSRGRKDSTSLVLWRIPIPLQR